MEYNIATKQMMDIRPSKGISNSQSDEHKRNWSEDSWDWASEKGNYDRSRSHLNFEITKGGVVTAVDKSKRIYQLMAENLAQRGMKDPNENLQTPKFRTVVNILFGGDTNRMRELAFGNQEIDWKKGADNSHVHRCKDIEEWAKDIYNFVAEKWGEENIVCFSVHLDESNPHIHCTLLPILDNKFDFKKLFAGKNKFEFKLRTTQLHDELAKVNEKWGLHRGDSIYETGAKHRSTEEYRRSLSQECTELERQVEEKKAILSDLDKDIRLNERKVKGLTTMVEKREERKTELEKELLALAEKVKTNQGDADDLQRQISKLDLELQRVSDDLDDKKAKLENANEELEQLKQLKAQAVKAMDDINEQLKEANSDNLKQTQLRLVDSVFYEFLAYCRHAYPKLPQEAKELYDDTLFTDLIERGENIIKCAFFLFFNAVDKATDFAETHGGGGSSSDLPWGRKDDEDDKRWAYRCMTMARQMMRPASRSIKR